MTEESKSKESSLTEQIKLELKQMDLKIYNQVRHLRELHEKIQTLQDEIDKIEAGIQKNTTIISKIGLKNPRADGKPESEDQKARKREYNVALYEAKMNFIKLYLSKETIEEINKYLPPSYGSF